MPTRKSRNRQWSEDQFDPIADLRAVTNQPLGLLISTPSVTRVPHFAPVEPIEETNARSRRRQQETLRRLGIKVTE